MSNWVERKLHFGDHIRVSRGLYYHHGIYLTKRYVVHFSAFGVKGANNETASELAKIIKTNLTDFARGDRIEAREFTEEENKKRLKGIKLWLKLRKEIGKRQGTYNLINNNCEHFANEMLFGTKSSEQMEHIFKHLMQIPNQRKKNAIFEEEKKRVQALKDKIIADKEAKKKAKQQAKAQKKSKKSQTNEPIVETTKATKTKATKKK